MSQLEVKKIRKTNSRYLLTYGGADVSKPHVWMEQKQSAAVSQKRLKIFTRILLFIHRFFLCYSEYARIHMRQRAYRQTVEVRYLIESLNSIIITAIYHHFQSIWGRNAMLDTREFAYCLLDSIELSVVLFFLILSLFKRCHTAHATRRRTIIMIMWSWFSSFLFDLTMPFIAFKWDSGAFEDACLQWKLVNANARQNLKHSLDQYWYNAWYAAMTV